MVEITDLSSGPPYNYQIANLVAGVTYYVRVSAIISVQTPVLDVVVTVFLKFRPRFAVPANQIPGLWKTRRLVRQELQQAPPTLRRSPFRGISQLLMAVQW